MYFGEFHLERLLVLLHEIDCRELAVDVVLVGFRNVIAVFILLERHVLFALSSAELFPAQAEFRLLLQRVLVHSLNMQMKEKNEVES